MVLNLTNLSMDGPTAAVDSNAIECSSSFGDAASRCENISGTSDKEVESEFWGENAVASMFNTNNSVLSTRRKKVTRRGKNFRRALMWRCKWAEQRIKELEAQVKKYSREREEIDQTKLLESDQFALENCSKAVPFVGHCFKRKSLKRRKWKQLTSHHRNFSYIENKKSDLGGTSTVNDIAVIDQMTKPDGTTSAGASGCALVPEIPDVIESTARLLSAIADVNIDHIVEDPLLEYDAGEEGLGNKFKWIIDECFSW